MNKIKIVVNKNDWRFKLIISLGIFLLINTLVFIVLSGGRWFEEKNPSINGTPEYYNDLNRVFGPFFMLGYFTVQTNIFAGVMLVVLSFYLFSSKAQSWFMGSLILIFITFFVYWTILAPGNAIYKWKSPYFTISNIFLHAVNPIIAFSVFVLLRKDLLINKRILGLCSMWMAVFFVYSAIFYGVSSTVSKENPTLIQGSVIYSFLDLQHLFYINFTKHLALGVFANIFVLLLAPFLPILVSLIFIKSFKIETVESISYFRWMDLVKLHIKKRKEDKKNNY